MTNGWSPLYVALWIAASQGPDASYLGLYTALPQFAEEQDAFDEWTDDPLSSGLEVVSIVENSPAAAAGFQVGDRVLRIGKTDSSESASPRRDRRAAAHR